MKSHPEKSSLALWLFAAGFFACTWDTLFTHELGGFTIKLYQPLFLLSSLAVLCAYRQKGLATFVRPLGRPFAACMLLLAGYNMGLSPWSAFPLKSFLYSGWLLFAITVIWLTAQHLRTQISALVLPRIAWFTLNFLSLVVLVDQVAYQFGKTGGLIGGNQDSLLHWGMSRPHAFSSEPSYLASFLGLGLLTCAAQIWKSSQRKWMFWASLLLILFANVATTSRTGWVALGLGLGAYVFFALLAGRRVPWRFLAAFLAMVTVVVAIFYLSTPHEQRTVLKNSLVNTIATGNDGSGNARLRAHILAFHFAQDTHWLGTGMGASYRYFLNHGGTDSTVPAGFTSQHYGNEVIMSMWGQLLAEGGPVSVLLFALSGFFMTRELFRRWKKENDLLALGSLSASVVFFGFIAFWIGNVCRGDIWVWYALWSASAVTEA